MSYVNGKIEIIRDYCIYTRMDYNFTSCIYQIFMPQFIDFFMEPAKCFCCCVECIVSLFHRECATVCSKTIEFYSVDHLTQYAGNNTDIFSCIFQNRSLFNMQFKQRFIFIGRHSVFDVAFIFKLAEFFTKSHVGVQNRSGSHHFVVFEVVFESFGHIIMCQNAGAHHARREFRTFFVCKDHCCQWMFMRNVLFNNSFQNFHSTHYPQNTIVVTTVFYGVAMRTHYDSFCIWIGARNGCIDICQIVCFNFSTDGFHSLYKFISCHFCFF